MLGHPTAPPQTLKGDGDGHARPHTVSSHMHYASLRLLPLAFRMREGRWRWPCSATHGVVTYALCIAAITAIGVSHAKTVPGGSPGLAVQRGCLCEARVAEATPRQPQSLLPVGLVQGPPDRPRTSSRTLQCNRHAENRACAMDAVLAVHHHGNSPINPVADEPG
jgi:hypothetical protein